VSENENLDQENEEEQGRREQREQREQQRQSRSSSRGRPSRGRRGRRRKEDYFYANDMVPDYKDVDTLRRFMTDRAKIRPRRQTGLTSKHQRLLARQIKRARHLALLPFTDEHMRS
jgi:small subunit ribosomal protein S18